MFVTGTSAGANSGLDYAMAYRTRTGARLWVKRYNGPAMTSTVPSQWP